VQERAWKRINLLHQTGTLSSRYRTSPSTISTLCDKDVDGKCRLAPTFDTPPIFAGGSGRRVDYPLGAGLS